MENISANPEFSAKGVLHPKPHSPADVQRGIQQWAEQARQQDDKPFGEWMLSVAGERPEAGALMQAVFGNSPHLSRLLLQYPRILHDLLLDGPDATRAQILLEAGPDTGAQDDYGALMRSLRIAKNKFALLTALSDMGGWWTLEQVTASLSDFAEHALRQAVDAILRAAIRHGEIALPHPETPSKDSGIIVLGLGKLGGRELNYSSDVDLIVFYEPGRIGYNGRHNEQHFMNRLCHDLVNIMQERTESGYVFRTDLRLRPDPASTPPAVTTEAAYYYYESVGQNWERAAMIKARPVAADIPAGERFLKNVSPFMWRRNLDFAAIADIHSIKRQMDSIHSKAIEAKGHNIKLGMGGIREIEFYAQIHQLIWGGREPSLRTRGTCETLAVLAGHGLIDEEKQTLMHEAYVYFRTLEHRLQMVDDEQTHSLPETDGGMAHIAHFMGYDDTSAFARDLVARLSGVHGIYASSFTSEGRELGEAGNLVFTGVSHDPDTLQTLRGFGYMNPERVSEIVMGWHHGSKRATRTKRARELLTELMPLLLKRLSETANADAAFLKFDEFLTNLPAGVQLFSLFNANPHLLGLIADIMGSAPTLADSLSKNPELLDAVLYEDFYGALPSPSYLTRQLHQAMHDVQDADTGMHRIRHFRNERQFQVGVQLLKGMINAKAAGTFLSQLADVAIARTLDIVTAEFTKTYGSISDSHFAVIALGKLGSREMTFGSDIDLVFVYDAEPDRLSDGGKGFNASVYYNRLAQRFVGALAAMGRGGRLYEVDTRLRPSGAQGLLAVSLPALKQYFDELAWTFEYMAFSKARVIIGEARIKKELDAFIHEQMVKPRDGEKLRADVIDMRERIDSEHGSANPWDIKYVRGGLIDLDFLSQYLLLLNAPRTPGAKPGSAADILHWLQHSGRMPAPAAQELIEADRFLGQIFNMLRLTCDKAFDVDGAPPGLKKLLVESVKAQDFEALKVRLIQVEQLVRGHYSSVLQRK